MKIIDYMFRAFRSVREWGCALAMGAVMLLASCDPVPNAVSKNVDIELSVELVSAGFCRVSCSTSAPAYFLLGCKEVLDREEPDRYPQQFMNLALDSAYMTYITWRHQLLLDGCQYVATFADHSLQYFYATKNFQFLDPDCDYWVFAFVVDAESNKPVGDLHITTIHTDSVSRIPMKFNYRVNGLWDYGYPLDTAGAILADVPWVSATVDSLMLRERGFRVPGAFFADSFAVLYANRRANTHFGVYACENNGENASCHFQEGHTYYTGLASLDGQPESGVPPQYYSIFRFTWQGDSTQLFLTHDSCNTAGAW